MLDFIIAFLYVVVMTLLGGFVGMVVSSIYSTFFKKSRGSSHFSNGFSDVFVMLPCLFLGLGLGFSYGLVHA